MNRQAVVSRIANALYNVSGKHYLSSDLSIEHIDNRYGINKEVYKVFTNDMTYFIKISDKKRNILTNQLNNYLCIPQNYSSQSSQKRNLIIDEYVDGKLFTDIVLQAEKTIEMEDVLKLEKKKNEALLKMYSGTKSIKRYFDVINSEANCLYFESLLGNRYIEYYDNKRFKDLFSKKLIINGNTYDSVNEIIFGLKEKYLTIKQDYKIRTILGHGDAHHQNILVENKTSKIYFIDNEYNSFIPINMELAKPYYIDILGNFFFFFNSELLKYIEVILFSISDEKIRIDTKTKKLPKLRIKIAQNKINTFKELIRDCNDPISLNEYLIMCHMLSRNPSKYSEKVLPIFLAYIPILNSFNSLKPEELFKF